MGIPVSFADEECNYVMKVGINCVGCTRLSGL